MFELTLCEGERKKLLSVEGSAGYKCKLTNSLFSAESRNIDGVPIERNPTILKEFFCAVEIADTSSYVSNNITLQYDSMDELSAISPSYK